jgi:UDP-glucose 4-epimerase
MRLLVTGANGFIGRNMLLAFPHSWEVVALYRSGNHDFQAFLKAHRLDHVYPLACDLTDACQVEQAVGQIGRNFDTCLALASNTSIPVSIQRPIYDLTTNVNGLLHLLQACTFEHLVYLSSGAVYIGLSGIVGPTSVVSPTLPYAISKLAAEHYIRAHVIHRHSPTYATIIRFFGAYGPYEPSRKLYTKLVRRFAFERNPYFTVIGDGKNFIDAMYVGDAVKALLAVLERPPAEKVRCIDLGVGSGDTINEIVTRAAHLFGLEPVINHEGSSAEYIQFVVDPEPFRLAYQFLPSIPLEVGLMHLFTHLQKEDKL